MSRLEDLGEPIQKILRMRQKDPTEEELDLLQNVSVAVLASIYESVEQLNAENADKTYDKLLADLKKKNQQKKKREEKYKQISDNKFIDVTGTNEAEQLHKEEETVEAIPTGQEDVEAEAANSAAAPESSQAAQQGEAVIDETRENDIISTPLPPVVLQGVPQFDPSDLEAVFDLYDTEKAGIITHDDFMMALRGMTLDPKDVKSVQTPYLDYEQFCDALSGANDKGYEERSAFGIFCCESDSHAMTMDSKIDITSLFEVVRRVEPNVEFCEVEEVFAYCDSDKDGFITMDDWNAIMKP
eukprot:PhM_4_TR14013/c0_g1_i1/m.64196